MHTKTMEGLIGARTNMNLTREPMRVYKEARRKGNTAVMERAMGYVHDFEDRAYEYKDKADEGMKEEARENREKEKLEREKALEERREERKEQEAEAAAKIQDNRSQSKTDVQTGTDPTNNLQVTGTDQNTDETANSVKSPGADSVKISPEGMDKLNQATDTDRPKAPGAQLDKPVFYSSAGVEARTSQNDAPTLNVSV